MLKEFCAWVGIIDSVISIFSLKSHPKLAAWGGAIGFAGLVGAYAFP